MRAPCPPERSAIPSKNSSITGLLKRSPFCPFETCCFFNTKIKGFTTMYKLQCSGVFHASGSLQKCSTHLSWRAGGPFCCFFSRSLKPRGRHRQCVLRSGVVEHVIFSCRKVVRFLLFFRGVRVYVWFLRVPFFLSGKLETPSLTTPIPPIVS